MSQVHRLARALLRAARLAVPAVPPPSSARLDTLPSPSLAPSSCSAYNHDGVPMHIVRHLIRQTLVALDFLHSKCNIIHTGERNATGP